MTENFFNRNNASAHRNIFASEIFSSKIHIKKGDIVFDLGASIGTTAMIFSKYVGETGKVFAVEPVTHNVLQKNLRANHIENVSIIPKAVADKEGQTEIFISDFCLDSSITPYENPREYYSLKKLVAVTTLDALVQDTGVDKVDFIKMDIEGAEEWAIKGAINVIETHHPKWSISSYHKGVDNEPQHKKLARLLKEYKYTIREEDTSHIFAW